MIDETFAQLLIDAQGCVLAVGCTSDKLEIFDRKVRVQDDTFIYVFRDPNGENAVAFAATQPDAKINLDKESLMLVGSNTYSHSTQYTFRWEKGLDKLWLSYDPLEKDILYPIISPGMRRAFSYASWKRISHSQVGVAGFLDIVYYNFGDMAADYFEERLRDDAYINIPFVKLPAKQAKHLLADMLVLRCVKKGCSPHISKRRIVHNPGVSGNVHVPFYQAADLSAVHKVVSEQLEVMKR